MSKPRVSDMQDLKRLGIYLIGNERMVTTFKRQDEVSGLDVWTDID